MTDFGLKSVIAAPLGEWVADTVRAPLGRLAYARSGDKGDDANVGVWIPADHPHRQTAFAWLVGFLDEPTVRELLPERRVDAATPSPSRPWMTMLTAAGLGSGWISTYEARTLRVPRGSSEDAKDRQVGDAPIGAHQAIAHPLAQSYIEIEMARLMTQKAAALYASGDVMRAAGAANMAKYAAGEAVCNAVDRAIQTHGGNGLATEYGLVQMLVGSRLSRIAPVSREMALNFVAQFSLGLPKSY